MTEPERVLVSWSGGKDSALALRAVQADPALRVAGLLTTVTEGYDRISMHGVRRTLLRAQADALGIRLIEVQIPMRASNESYEAAMLQALGVYRGRHIERVVFGDLFLADVRAYRERLLDRVQMDCLFPLWGLDTRALASEFIAAGFRAILCAVDPRQIDARFCGRDYDERLLSELPAGADPCGEHGEFHTFVHDGPPFGRPVGVQRGEVVERDGFWFCDLLDA